MSEPLLLESDAIHLQQNLHAYEGDDLSIAQRRLDFYKKAQEAQGQPMFPQHEADKQNRRNQIGALWLDGEEGFKQLSKDKEELPWQDEKGRKDFAEVAALSELFGANPATVAVNPEAYRAQLGKTLGKEFATDDDIKQIFQRRRDDSIVRIGGDGGRDGALLPSMRAGIIRGQTFEQAFREWDTVSSKHLKGYDPDQRASYREHARQFYEAQAEQRREVAPVARKILAELRKDTGQDEGSGSMTEAARLFSSLSDADKIATAEMIGEFNSELEQNSEAGTGEALGRPIQRLFDGMNQLAGEIQDGDRVDVGGEKGNFFSFDSFTPSQNRLSLIMQNRAADFQTLRQIAASEIDPLEKDGVWDKIYYGGLEATSSMATMLAPGGVQLNAQAYMMEARAELLNQGVAADTANEAAFVTGVAQASLDRVQLSLFKGMPGLSKIKSNGVAKFIGRAAGTIAAETGIEILQDPFTPAAVNEIFTALGKDMPEVDWKQVAGEAWAQTPDVAAAMLIPALIGSGAASVRDVRQGRRDAQNELNLRAMGYSQAQREEIMGAETDEAAGEAMQKHFENREPNSEDAQAAIAEKSAQLAEQRELEEDAQRTGALPGVRALPNRGGFEVFDTDTGEVIATSDNAEGATVAMLEARNMREQTSMAQMDYFASLLEGAQELQAKDGDGRATTFEIKPDEALTVEQVALESAGSMERVRAQLETEEKLGGLDGSAAAYVFGSSATETEGRQRQTLNKLQAGSTAFTLVHEDAHGWFQEALEQGRLTIAETSAFFGQLDAKLDGKTTKQGQSLRFIPDIEGAPTFEQVDEAVAKFAEVMVLQTENGKKSKFRSILNKNLSAIAEQSGKSVGKNLKAFVIAMREYFGVALARHLHIKRGIADGSIDKNKIDEFRAKLQGTTVQEEFEAETAGIAQEIYTPPSAAEEADGIAFSVGNANTPVDLFLEGSVIKEPVFHGTPDVRGVLSEGFEPSSRSEQVHFFTDSKRVAETYADDRRAFDYQSAEPHVVSVYLSLKKPLIVDAKGKKWRDTAKHIEVARDGGHDGLQILNSRDEYNDTGGGGSLSTVYAVFSGDQVKSADVGNFTSRVDGIDLGGASFSVGNSELIDVLRGDVLKRAKRPETRLQIMRDIARRLEEQRRDVDQTVRAFGKDGVRKAITDPRQVKSLKKEAAMRHALRLQELEDPIWERYAEHFENEDLTKLRNQPVHNYIADPKSPLKGSLMSASAAAQRDGLIDGQWDGADGINRTVFGGSIAPAEMAQELFNEGLIQSPTPDSLWTALKAEQAGVVRGKATLRRGQQELREAKAQAREESAEWLAEALAGQKRDHNPLARVRRSLATLDAIVMALPIQLRGKIGGFTQIANLNSDEKRMEFLQKRIEKVDVVVEKWIKSEQTKAIKKLFKRAEVKKTAKGVPKAKLAADYTDEVLKVKAASEMPKAEVDAKIQELAEKIDEDPVGELADDMRDEMVFLLGFGNLEGMDSRQALDFHDNLLSVVNTGLMLKQVLDGEATAEVERLQGIVNNDVTGGKGRLTSSAAKQRAKSQERFASLSKFHRKNVSFEWLLNGLSRENKQVGTLKSQTNKELATMVHKATHAEKRRNMETQEEFRDFLSGVFDVKGLKLSKAIAKFSEEQESTGVLRIDYGTHGKTVKKQARVQNIEAILDGGADAAKLGFTKQELKAATAVYREMKKKTRNGSLKPNRIVRYLSETKGVEEQLTLSQDQALTLTMLYRQEGLRDSMEHEGYSPETMKQMEKFLSPEALQIRDWLAEQYDANYDTVNDVFKVENGVNLPKIHDYSPARRLADGTAKTMEIDSGGRSAMSTTPNFTISRTTNFAQMDQTVGALSLYIGHMAQTNHFVEWAQPINKLRRVFGDKEVKKNIEDYQGKSLLSIINERIEWMADGGNRHAAHERWLDAMRSTFTMSKLAYNWGVGLKQLTSLPAYAFDMGLADFGKYSAQFMANPVGNLKEMLATDYVKTRFKEGYERDVIEALNKDGGIIRKGLQTGMLFGKAGDIVPVMVGGWMAKQRAYDRAIADGRTEAQAEVDSLVEFEMVTDRAQQAGDMKDLSSFQGGGSIAKLFTMFKTSPRQYYANVYESLLDFKAGKAGSGKEFARRFLIGHVILPMSFQFAADMINSPFNDDEEEDFSPQDYVRAILLGPLNGLFILGDGADMILTGIADAHLWGKDAPLSSGFKKLGYAAKEIHDGDFGSAVDEIARGIGELVASPFTYYDILRRETDKVGITD